MNMIAKKFPTSALIDGEWVTSAKTFKVTDPEGFDREYRRYWQEVCKWRHELAERKRAEKAKEPPSMPEERYVKEARAMIDAVLDRHLRPHEDYDDPDIERQVGLILKHHLKLFREATGWKPIDDDTQF